MDTELEIIEALKDIGRAKVESEAEACGAAPVLSGRKSWLEFKRRNAKSWSEAMIAMCGSQTMKVGGGSRETTSTASESSSHQSTHQLSEVQHSLPYQPHFNPSLFTNRFI